MPVAEAYGGFGLGPVETVVLMESRGRRLFCAPYFSTACLAATLIAETAREDSQAGPLAAIVEGRMRFGVAIADGDWTLAAQGLHAALDAQDWRLSGEAAAVIDGASADTLLLFATLADGIGLFAVPRASDGLVVTPLQTWDATRRFARVTLDRVAAERLDAPQRVCGFVREIGREWWGER